jgi:hypothetical protein
MRLLFPLCLVLALSTAYAGMTVMRRPLSSVSAYCGDGIRNGSDECDGSDYGVSTCATYSCTGGSLTCSSCIIGIGSCTGCGGNLLNETFTGTGYDNTWTESGTGTIDEDETASCGSGTGWATDCLEVAVTATQTGASTSAFASQTGDVWVRFRAKITYSLSGSSDGTGFYLASLNGSVSSAAAGGTTIAIKKYGGPVYEVSIMEGTNELDYGTAPASGETHCYEFKHNSGTDAYEWWIDGVSQGSGTAGGFGLSAVTNVWTQGNTIPTNGSATIYIDDVQVSNSARQTCS